MPYVIITKNVKKKSKDISVDKGQEKKGSSVKTHGKQCPTRITERGKKNIPINGPTTK